MRATLKEGTSKVKNRAPKVALALLKRGMTSEYSNTQAELKTTRQILVRFAHAPCVKLTLEPRPVMVAEGERVRILRLRPLAAPLGR